MKYNLLRIGSEALWVFGGQVGVALGGLVSVKILTHLLNPYEFGRFSIANTVILLIGVNLFGPLGQGVMRYWAIADNQRSFAEYISVSRKYIIYLFSLSLLISIVTVLLLYLSQKQEWVGIIGFALICGAFTGWLGTRLSILIADRKRKQVSVINVMTAFGKPIAAGVLILLIAHQADIAIFGFLIVCCASAFAAEYVFKTVAGNRKLLLSQTGVHIDKNLQKSLLHFSMPFFVWSFFAWAHQSCDRWALLTFEGADSVGAYSVISLLAYYPLVFASGFLSNFLIPIAYQRAGALQNNRDISAANRVLLAMGILYATGAGLLVLVFYLFHRPLVLLVSNQQYAAYSSLLPMLTASWSVYYLGQILSGFGFLANKPNVYILPIVCTGVLAVMTTFFLGYEFGIVGIIWALGITGCLYAGWCLMIAKRLMTVQAAV